MNKWCEKEIAEMIEALSSCNSPEEICSLFDVITTPREINDIARRYKIKEMLEEGQSYTEIKMRLGVSSDVISRVSAHIGYGFRRSDAKVLDGVHRKELKKQWHDTLQKKKEVYYKGVPSIGTMARSLKK